LLDLVYTAKAFSGMLGKMEMGRFGKDEPIIFLHPGVLSDLFVFDANKLGMNF